MLVCMRRDLVNDMECDIEVGDNVKWKLKNESEMECENEIVWRWYDIWNFWKYFWKLVFEIWFLGNIFVDLIIIPKSWLVDFGIMIESFELLFERYGSGSPSDLLTANVSAVNESSGLSFLYILCMYSVTISHYPSLDMSTNREDHVKVATILRSNSISTVRPPMSFVINSWPLYNSQHWVVLRWPCAV